jgi:hypothetical protein
MKEVAIKSTKDSIESEHVSRNETAYSVLGAVAIRDRPSSWLDYPRHDHSTSLHSVVSRICCGSFLFHQDDKAYMRTEYSSAGEVLCSGQDLSFHWCYFFIGRHCAP